MRNCIAGEKFLAKSWFRKHTHNTLIYLISVSWWTFERRGADRHNQTAPKHVPCSSNIYIYIYVRAFVVGRVSESWDQTQCLFIDFVKLFQQTPINNQLMSWWFPFANEMHTQSPSNNNINIKDVWFFQKKSQNKNMHMKSVCTNQSKKVLLSLCMVLMLLYCTKSNWYMPHF